MFGVNCHVRFTLNYATRRARTLGRETLDAPKGKSNAETPSPASFQSYIPPSNPLPPHPASFIITPELARCIVARDRHLLPIVAGSNC
jgi:hypothetical protein